jgi:8-oxo-dGTP pyrophosphatase MutT (NUDIX family)
MFEKQDSLARCADGLYARFTFAQRHYFKQFSKCSRRPNLIKFSGRTTVAIVEFSDKRILLIKRRTVPFKGYWALPGGRVEAGETVEQTVIREAKEETGLDVEIVKKIGEYREKGFKDGVEYDYSPACFLVRPVAGEIRKQESEIEEIRQVDVEKIPTELAFEHSKMLHDYFTMRRNQLTHTDIIKKLSQHLGEVLDEQGANAAVALLIKGVTNPSILFVKRIQNPTDPWSGQIALPGGKRDGKDKNLKDTVIRETLEETGINLEQCCFLGVMNVEKSTPRPEIKVLPFIIFLEHEPAITLSERELEKYVWIPIEKLAKSKTTITFSFGESPAYVINDTVIWGLTQRIIEELIQILEI